MRAIMSYRTPSLPIRLDCIFRFDVKKGMKKVYRDSLMASAFSYASNFTFIYLGVIALHAHPLCLSFTSKLLLVN